MPRSLRAFGLAALLAATSPSIAQVTGPDQKGTTKSAAGTATDTSGYTIKTLKIAPITRYEMPKHDNAGIDSAKQFRGSHPLPDSFYYAGEKHLKNIRQLTFEGENAEAYLSPDDQWISFQAHGKAEKECDQIFTMKLDGSGVHRISQGIGRTTCSYYLPGQDKILYASTQGGDGLCPPEPDMSKGYVWPLYGTYDIYVADLKGNPLGRLTSNENCYDAEATISPKGDKIIFTSTRAGNIDLYSMNLDGSAVTRLTDEPGYNGGAFYSLDGSQIVYRASRPQGDELKEFKDLLKQGLVRPHQLEIMVMDADGSNKHQVTSLHGASFAPFFHPDGKRIIFSSNFKDPKGRAFDLFMIHTDGTGLEQITFGGAFNSFPMFTRDGKHLVFCSNRNGSHPHNTNIFVADWVE